MLLQSSTRQHLIRSLERAQRSEPKRYGYHGQHGDLVYKSVFINDGELITLCEVAGPAPRVSSMTVHNIPVHGAWLNVFFALHCAICTALGCSANCVLSVPYINIALHVRATYYSRENGILQ